jgi:hypothetical protein
LLIPEVKGFLSVYQIAIYVENIAKCFPNGIQNSGLACASGTIKNESTLFVHIALELTLNGSNNHIHLGYKITKLLCMSSKITSLGITLPEYVDIRGV